MSMLDKDTFKAMLSSTSPGEASGPLLAKFGDFAQCAADNGLNVRDNKPELSKSDGPLSTTRNALVFQAAEIGGVSEAYILTLPNTRPFSLHRLCRGPYSLLCR